MQKHWKTYLFWVVLAEAVGALAGWLTRVGVRSYNLHVIKPALSPPAWVFPVVWAILYALMGVGAARVALTPAGKARTAARRAFGVQLAFNFVWSILFFNFQAYGAAFLWLVGLWALIVWMTLRFAEADKTAALLQLPYLLWVFFAGYLNLGVWLLNR